MLTSATTADLAAEADMIEKTVETEIGMKAAPAVVRAIETPPLARHETDDSVEIVCEVLA